MISLLLAMWSFAWTWGEIGRPYLGDLSQMESQFLIDLERYPVASMSCTDLECTFTPGPEALARLAQTGRHEVQLIVRQPGMLWSFPVSGSYQVVTGCPYTNPNTGVTDIKPMGYVIGRAPAKPAFIPFTKTPGDVYGSRRLEQLTADGWWVVQKGSTALGVYVELVCMGVLGQ